MLRSGIGQQLQVWRAPIRMHREVRKGAGNLPLCVGRELDLLCADVGLPRVGDRPGWGIGECPQGGSCDRTVNAGWHANVPDGSRGPLQGRSLATSISPASTATASNAQSQAPHNLRLTTPCQPAAKKKAETAAASPHAVK